MLRTILAFIATMAVSRLGLAQQLTFTEVPILTPGNSIIDFAVPIQGDPLFTEFEGNRIGILMPDRVVEFPIPTPSSGPTAIAAVGSFEFWFTEFNASRIGRLRYFPPGPTPITFLGEIELPTPNSGPRDIVSNLGIAWVTEFNGNKIARVSGDGSVVEFPVPTPSSGPTGITRDGAGRIWFTEFIANKIGRLDPPTGVITEFPIPTPNSGPLQIVVSGGDIWFTESNAGKVGRVRSDGSIVEYALPDVASSSYGISGDASGGAWFTERGSGRIGRVTPDGRVQEFALPTPASGPTGIFFYDPRVARPPVLLVAESGVNRIARAAADEYVAIVGAGNSGSWDTEIVLSNREDYPVEVTLGPYGGFPEQCFHALCGSPSVVIPARGTTTVSTGTILRAGAHIETWYVSPHGFDLPTVKARAVNRANPFQSMDLPALRHSTIAGLNPLVLSFPGAAKSPAGARSNLILSHVAGTREAITVRVEAISASGSVLGAESFVLDRPTATLFIGDVVGRFGVSELQGGQIRVIKTAGAGLLWGILATATEEGSFSVTVGQNP